MSVILFDIDGTLLSSGGAGRLAMQNALAEEFQRSEEIPPGMMAGRTDRGIIQMLFELHGLEESEENIAWFVLRYLSLLTQAMHLRAGGILPGVEELLAALQETGSHIGLLTGNMARGAQIKLDHHGLAEHFPFGAFGDARLTRDELAQDAFDTVREHIGAEIQAEEIWIIGDTPRDISCARAIGARVLAVATGVNDLDDLSEHGPDLLLDDLSDTAAVRSKLGVS
ncbi:MAG: HAD hydrolase-like protein [Pirellulales bacterium]|nr:HAD hydrolase-like protein [Pirellulales bacterium]